MKTSVAMGLNWSRIQITLFLNHQEPFQNQIKYKTLHLYVY